MKHTRKTRTKRAKVIAAKYRVATFLLCSTSITFKEYETKTRPPNEATKSTQGNILMTFRHKKLEGPTANKRTSHSIESKTAIAKETCVVTNTP